MGKVFDMSRVICCGQKWVNKVIDINRVCDRMIVFKELIQRIISETLVYTPQ